MRSALLLVSVALPACSQIVSVGVEAGVPIEDAVSTSFNFSHATPRYVVGATAEAHLPFGFSIELNALYRRIGFDYYFQSVDLGTVRSRTTANQWDFPLLAKYEIGSRMVRPFVEAGPVLRHLSGIDELTNSLYFYPYGTGVPSSIESNNSVYLRNRNSAGFSAGGGVTIKWQRVRISPEIRYTRWANEAFAATTFGNLNSNLNQLDVLVGFTF